MNIREYAMLKIDLCPCCSKKAFYPFVHLGSVMFLINLTNHEKTFHAYV